MGSASAARSPAAAASALIEIRARAESLSAPPPLPRHLAFGKGFVVQARADEAIVLNSSDGSELARVPMKEPRAAVALPAGSVLVAALDGSYRFDPGQKRPHRLPRLSLLPGFVLEPRRDSQESLWVVQAPLRQIQRYLLDPSSSFGFESQADVKGYDGGPFATLSDGSFLYTQDGATLIRARPSVSKVKTFALPQGLGSVWRLAAGDRIDRAWVVLASGDILLVELAVRLRVVRSIHTGLRPFDFAATEKALIMVSVKEPADGPRAFSLHVFSVVGAQIYSQALDTVEVTAEVDWQSAASTEQEVAVSSSPPRIAVGGATSLCLFELASGTKLFELKRAKR